MKNGGTTFNARERIHQVRRDCEAVREGVGKDGDWLIDFHQRFDSHRRTLCSVCKVLEELEPFLVERSGAHGGVSRRYSEAAP